MSRKLKSSVVAVLIGLIIVIVAVYMLRDGVNVVIRNVSDQSLQSVTVHVTGNSYPIGDIDAGATKIVRVIATGESHIVIEYGNQEKLVVDTYFEKGYKGKISIDITSDQVVNVKNEIRTGPF